MQFMTKNKNHGKKNAGETKIKPSENLSLAMSTTYPSSEVEPYFFATKPSNQSNTKVVSKKIKAKCIEKIVLKRNNIEVSIESPDSMFGSMPGKGSIKPNLSVYFLKVFRKPNFLSSAIIIPQAKL